MKFIKKIYITIFIFLFSVLLFGYALFNYELSSVNDDDTVIPITIERGSISSIASALKDNKLIRSELFFKLYVKISGKTNLRAGEYELSSDMDTKDIIEMLSVGGSDASINITFKEGINMREVARVIAKNTNNTEDDVYSLLNDKEYLNEIIDKYWFLDDSILNSNIYYSLEGYLYPNTYSFASVDVSVKDIFKSMLDEMDKELSTYKDDIDDSSLSIHEIITLASMVELESGSSGENDNVASVFMNRINDDISLGSDVTTFYAAKVDMSERTYLYESELNDCNSYNTRCATYSGLPVGPICNPSIISIKASIDPIDSDYYYFVADKNGDVYFSKNLTQQNNTIYNLKKKGLWNED